MKQAAHGARIRYAAVSFAASALVGCGKTPETPVWFEEVARAVGVDFVHQSGHRDRYLFPEVISSGVALFDMDGDGDLDLYLVQGGRADGTGAPDLRNRLYANRGDGTFEDVTEGSGADDPGYGMGVATGDYDGDGDVDLYVTNLGRNTLLRNEGGGRFLDVTESAGVGGDLWSTSAAFVDYDGDGDLDLFAVNYIYWSVESEALCRNPGREPTYCSPKSYDAPTPDTLFRNEGNGRFVDVSSETGILERRGNGLGVVTADFDDDGHPELFVANDGTPNHLWRWDPSEGRFREDATRLGCAVDNLGAPKAGMGVAAVDLDCDGDEDLVVVNLVHETDSVFRNEGGRFSERAAMLGLALRSRERTRFGVGFFDFDHDGHLDGFQANGRVAHGDHTEAVADPFAEPDVVLRGTRERRFERVEPPGDLRGAPARTSRSAAFGDIDGDGDVDIVVHNRDAAPHVLRNTAPKAGGGYATLACQLASGAPALGAVLWIEAGGVRRRTEVRTADSYAAASSPDVHVGLGAVTAIDSVVVRWPDRSMERFGPLPAGARHVLRPGGGQPVERR